MVSLLVNNFRKEVSKSKDVRMSSEAQFSVAYPSGFLGVDFTNGQQVIVRKEGQKFTYNSVGFVDGSMISCVGRSGCGKTTFVLQAAGNIVRKFPNAAIFHEDIEGGSSDGRKRQLLRFSEAEFANKYICRNTGITTENFFQRVSMIHDMKLANVGDYEYDTGLLDSNGNHIFKLQPTVVILDSLAMLMPENLAEDDEMAGNMAAPGIARQNTQLIKRIIPKLKAANIIFFVINHLLPDPSLMPKKAQVAWLKQGERCPGGETAIYLANNFLRFDDGSKLKEDKDFGITGIMVNIQFIKSRTSAAGALVPMVFTYDHGFDYELSLLVLLKEKEALESGAWMKFKKYPDVKFTQKGFKQKLQEPEFANVFYEVCFDILNSLIAPAFDEEVLNEQEQINTTDVMLNMLYNQQQLAC